MRKCNCAYSYFVSIAGGVCVLIACLCRTPSAFAVDQATTIIVDAATVVAESGGDDLAAVKNIFQDANAPGDGSQVEPTRAKVIADIKMKRSRLLLDDVYCDLDVNGTFGNRPFPNQNGDYVDPVVPGECNNMMWHIQWALSHGLSPHVAVAYSMPQGFVQYGPAETWSPTIQRSYQSYARQLIDYVVRKSFVETEGRTPASSVVFEVSNELDLADGWPVGYEQWLDWLQHCATPCAPSDNPNALGFPKLGPWGRALWWWDPATFNLSYPVIWDHTYGYPFHFPSADDMRRMTRGIGPMQKIFAEAVAQVGVNYPGKLQIAGPALASATFTRAEDPTTHAPLPTLEETFIDYMFDRSAGPVLSADPDQPSLLPSQPTNLDYFSFHYYGDFHNGANGQRTSTLQYITSRILTKLAAAGHPETKLFASEWGPTTDESSDINYSHKGAAWTAAFLIEAVASHVAMGAYLGVSDFSGAPPTDPATQQLLPNYEGNAGGATLTHKVVANSVSTYYPKPPANVMQMFAMLTGTRRAVTLPAGAPNLGAFAASDNTSAGIVVFNYPYDYSFADTDQSFTLELNSLPFNGVVTVERYLVDRAHSNLKAFLDVYRTSSTATAPDPALQKVETISMEVVDGRLLLPPCTLGLGVTFFRILR